MLFGTLGIGLTNIYKDKNNIRDALDAAVTAVVSIAEVKDKPTYYGERYEGDDYEYWDKSTSPWTPIVPPKLVKKGRGWYEVTGDPEDYVSINLSQAQKTASFYFKKNMSQDKMNYKILDWDLDIDYEQRPLQVHKNRPETEGITTTWEENFPRYIVARVNVRIETPVPWGTMVGTKTIKTKMSTRALNEIK